MEAIECVLCENSRSEPVIQENGFTGRQCVGCGLIFVSPRPSREEMDELYESGEAHLSPEFFVANPDSRSARAHARSEVKRLRRHVTRGSLLEVGPGRGTFLVEARDAGFDVYGVELNQIQAEFMRTRRGIPCVNSLEAVSSIGPQRFDVVYHCDVLSHFYDPIEEFRHINELLVEGGYHVFQTGNFGDIDHKYFRYIKSFQYPDHLFFHSNRSLQALLQQTGFEHVHTYRYSTLPGQRLRTQLLRLFRRHEDDGAAESSTAHPGESGVPRIVRNVFDYINYLLRYSVGALVAKERDPQTLIVVARKPA